MPQGVPPREANGPDAPSGSRASHLTLPPPASAGGMPPRGNLNPGEPQPTPELGVGSQRSDRPPLPLAAQMQAMQAQQQQQAMMYANPQAQAYMQVRDASVPSTSALAAAPLPSPPSSATSSRPQRHASPLASLQNMNMMYAQQSGGPQYMQGGMRPPFQQGQYPGQPMGRGVPMGMSPYGPMPGQAVGRGGGMYGQPNAPMYGAPGAPPGAPGAPGAPYDSTYEEMVQQRRSSNKAYLINLGIPLLRTESSVAEKGSLSDGGSDEEYSNDDPNGMDQNNIQPREASSRIRQGCVNYADNDSGDEEVSCAEEAESHENDDDDESSAVIQTAAAPTAAREGGMKFVLVLHHYDADETHNESETFFNLWRINKAPYLDPDSGRTWLHGSIYTWSQDAASACSIEDSYFFFATGQEITTCTSLTCAHWIDVSEACIRENRVLACFDNLVISKKKGGRNKWKLPYATRVEVKGRLNDLAQTDKYVRRFTQVSKGDRPQSLST